MSGYWESAEEMVYQSRIKIPYSWQAGETASFFLTQLRDEKKIWGLKCGQCHKVLVPPRKSCPYCLSVDNKWVEVKDNGTVETFTIVRRDTNIQPMKAPFAYALIKLEGADTAFLHLLGEVEPKQIREGMKVKAVFAEKRSGGILDIQYFKPL